MVNPETKEIQRRIKKELQSRLSEFTWSTEESYMESDIDLFGQDDDAIVFIEMEMKREDPTSNIVNIVRPVIQNSSHVQAEHVYFFHVFSQFYSDIGGYMERRRDDATWLGGFCADQVDWFDYQDITLSLSPPRQSNSKLPDEWPPENKRREKAAETATSIASALR